MFKALQPVVAPVLLLGAEYLAIRNHWVENDQFVGVILGLGLFWLIAALLSNKALIERFPWVVDWAPFLKTSGSALGVALRENFIRGKTFALWEVAEGGRVVGKTFEDCVILGPAVLAAVKHTTLRYPKFISRQGDFWYQLELKPEGGAYPKDGIIQCEDCTFNRCTFDGIGVAGPNREEFIGQLQNLSPDASAATESKKPETQQE